MLDLSDKRMKLNIQLFASGTINGSSTASNGDCRIKWSSSVVGSTNAEKAQKNKSKVTAEIQIYKSGSGTTTGTFSGSITINGTKKDVSKYDTWTAETWHTVGKATVEVAHTVNGSKTIKIKGSLTQTGTSMAGTYTVSGNAELDNIPRYGILNDVSGYYIEDGYILDYTDYIEDDSITHTIYISDADVSRFSYTGQRYMEAESGVNYDFNYGQAPGSEPYISKFYSDITTKDYAKIRFTLDTTDADDNVLNSSFVYKTFYIKNGEPVFTDFEYEDINSTTLALTGDNQTIVKGYSNIKYIVSDTNKAVAQKEAEIYYYLAQGINGNTIMSPYIFDSYTYPLEITDDLLANYNNSYLKMWAIDTRRKTTEIEKIPSVFLDYYLPSISSVSLGREDEVGEKVYLNLNANFWPGDFGNGNNTLTNIAYRVKESGGNYGNWINITNSAVVDTTNGTASINDLRIYNNGSDFSIGMQYVVEVRIIDGISSSLQFNTVSGYEITIEDGYILDSYYKSSTGYKYAINKIVDPNGATLQVDGDIDIAITTGNLTITKTSGNSTATGTYAKCGNIVMVNVAISTTGTTNSGDNIFVGTISNFTPAINTMLSGFLGSRSILAGFGTSGTITVRNASASSISSGSSINVRGTFIAQ